MNKKSSKECGCVDPLQGASPFVTISPTMPGVETPGEDIPCCGPPAGPPSGPYEKPGYSICQFVEAFQETAPGPVPRIRTRLGIRDTMGSILTRTGIGRNNYKTAPGLYCTGTPDKTSPVLVTANYKLSFDHLRKGLDGINAWILVLDTRGINVWCAAGKGTFSTRELVRMVKKCRLEEIVGHRQVILPQLSAPGVSGYKVKRECGFQVVWGPVRAEEIGGFLNNRMTADTKMRRVTFSFTERSVLIPVEITLVLKPLFWIFLAMFLISGAGPDIFSLQGAWHRGVAAALSITAGVMAGAVLTPALLPWIPGTAFALKGLLAGIATGIPVAVGCGTDSGFSGITALVIFSAAVSSYLAMNFTGATPFTSPSGVEKEMKQYIPIQAGMVVPGLMLWLYSAF